MPHGTEDIHVDRLKPYLPMLSGIKLTLHYYKPHVDIPHDDSHVVEKILAHRIHHGQHQWRVRWQGYDSSHDTWEPASPFVGYLQLDWLKFNKDNHINFPLSEIQQP